jgi:hypothetical protein
VKKLMAIMLAVMAALTLSGCIFDHQSDVVSRNLSAEADSFRVLRRVVFYNGITGEYMLTIEGYCALGNTDAEGELTVICKTGVGDVYKKHFLGLSDNVTYFVEQIEGRGASPDHYKVIFKPETILPDIEVQ